MTLSCPSDMRGVADAIGGHLHQVFEQRDAPAHERGDDPGLRRHVLEVRVPGERHEDVRNDQQAGALCPDGQVHATLALLERGEFGAQRGDFGFEFRHARGELRIARRARLRRLACAVCRELIGGRHLADRRKLFEQLRPARIAAVGFARQLHDEAAAGAIRKARRAAIRRRPGSGNSAMRGARLRNSPGVCGPRNSSSHTIAVSCGVNLRLPNSVLQKIC